MTSKLINVFETYLEKEAILKTVQKFDKSADWAENGENHIGTTLPLPDNYQEINMPADDKKIREILDTVWIKHGVLLKVSEGLFFWHFRLPVGWPENNGLSRDD